MIKGSIIAEVERIIREIVGTEVLPRFGRLNSFDISLTDSGALVTVADRRAEARLADELMRVL